MNRSSLVWAFPMLLVAAPAAGQQCPVSEFGKSCGPGGPSSPWPGGLPQWTGICIQSTCSSTDANGATTDSPCGFCEPLACSLTDVGQPCEAGACTQATCLVVDDAGSSARQTCGVCLSPPADCTAMNVGAACGDGGVCTIGTVRTLGPAGAPPPSQLYYSVSECLVSVSPGDGGDADAAALGVPRTGDGSTSSTSPSASSPGSLQKSSASSGCGVAGTGDPCGFGLSFVTAAFLTAVRRRKRG